MEIVVNVSTSRDFFLKIAASDGTFGPRGTVFVTDWTVGNHGFPYAYLPDGTRWAINSYSSEALPNGAGGVYESFGYSGAVAVRNGRMLFGGAMEGVVEMRAAPVGAAAIDRRLYAAGKACWLADGLHLTHGVGGWGYYGLPLPWGHSPETNHYMLVHGHTQG